jgi:hypothetical protein
MLKLSIRVSPMKYSAYSVSSKADRDSVVTNEKECSTDDLTCAVEFYTA